MAELGMSSQLSIVSLAKRSNNAQLLSIAEVLAGNYDILDDAAWLEANDTATHVASIRATLPSGTWRQINEGVASSASTVRQIREEIGLLEAQSVVDAQLVRMASNPTKFRSDEDMAFLEGLGQQIANTLYNGAVATNPASFNGFITRYNTLGETDDSGRVITKGMGGTGSDLSSIFLIQWGQGQVYMVYPKNSKTLGLVHQDKGEQMVVSALGSHYWGYVSNFRFNGGLVVEDERCFRRIANVESTGSTNNLLDSVNDLIEVIISMKQMGRDAVMYMNRTQITQLTQDAVDKTNVFYDTANPYGKPLFRFQNVPIRVWDSIPVDEDAVS
jgi:hypothetical protein